MNGDRLFEAIGEIDCDLVNNADTAKKGRIKPFKIVIAVAAALVLLIGGALGVTFGKMSDYRRIDNEVNSLLESSKNKTVKNDIIKTVTVEKMYSGFGFFMHGVEGKSETLKDVNYVKGYYAENIMSIEPNGFIKANNYGGLYTVFKLDTGAYIYCLMDISFYDLNGEIYGFYAFDYAYWVYDKVLTVDAFDDVVIGKTTKAEVFEFTNEARVIEDSKIPYIDIKPIDDYESVKKAYQNNPSELLKDILNSIKVQKRSFLTTTGVMTVTFEYDETLGEHVVSAMEFTEGCPINPEDLI